MHPHLTPGIIARFWTKVDTSAGLFGCWPWTASLNAHGYGKFALCKERTARGRRAILIGAHRYSYILAHGPIPDGSWVLHNCPGGDNRRCVNPAHLWLGDALANNRDALAKRRRIPSRGETHGKAKLTEAAVIALRKQYADGMSVTALAGAYGVSRGTVSQVVHGHLWPHVGGAQPNPPRGVTRTPAGKRGESHPHARLTDDIVRCIRERIAGGAKTREMCACYGIAPNTVRAIARRASWKHLD